MKTNIMLTSFSTELELLSKKIGFVKTLFVDKDFVVINLISKKKVLSQIQLAKQKGMKTIAKPTTEDMLRFLLEKTQIDIVFGLESIHPKEHYHYLRGGLDQILAKIAHDKEKIIGFSFEEVLISKKPSQILGRMMHNIKMCKKFKVQTIFSTFATSNERFRSVNDLASLWEILGGSELEKMDSFEVKKD